MFRHSHPIRVHRKHLLHLGIDIDFFYSLDAPRIKECDVLIFMEGGFGELLPPGKDHVEALAPFLSSFRRAVWFDDHDSSGMLRTYILPLVDTYAKSQLLRNEEYYNEEHLTGVLHRDYTHERYGMEDKKLFKGAVGSDLSKLRLGWNFATLDWETWLSGRATRKLRLYFPSRKNRVRTTVPNLQDRSVHVSYRVGMWRNNPTIHWWRQRAYEELQSFSHKHPQFRCNMEGKLSMDGYIEEMRNTVITPSPFGMGEICYRDFESFLCGSLLLKPRMNHLKTWPDLFIEDETYIAHEWDYSDFTDKLHAVLSDPQKYESIAREGQRRFVNAIEDGAAFAQHFKAMIEP